MGDNSSKNIVERKPRVGCLQWSFLIFTAAFLILSLLMSLCFYINDDFFYGEVVKGPNPIAGFISSSLLFIGFYMYGVAIIIGFMSFILSTFRMPRLANLGISFCGLLLLLFANAIFMSTYERVRSSPSRWCPQNMKRLGYFLKEYTEAHDGRLPPAENWCDVLVEPEHIFNYFKCPCANTPKGMSSYALNERIAGMCLADIPKDVVLLFETKPAKNPVGDKKLITAENHKGKGCVVLFGDLRVEFIKAKDFNDLRWEP